MEIEFTRARSDVPQPTYAKNMDAGMDLHADNKVTIAPGDRVMVDTGLSLAIPEGYAGFILSRSGLAFKFGVIVANSPGLVDAGYRGEVKVLLYNTSLDKEYEVNVGDRIAQLVIQRVESVSLVEAVTLSKTERGEGGFGHSGQ